MKPGATARAVPGWATRIGRRCWRAHWTRFAGNSRSPCRCVILRDYSRNTVSRTALTWVEPDRGRKVTDKPAAPHEPEYFREKARQMLKQAEQAITEDDRQA